MHGTGLPRGRLSSDDAKHQKGFDKLSPNGSKRGSGWPGPGRGFGKISPKGSEKCSG